MIPLEFLLENDKNRGWNQWKNKAKEAEKLRDELLKLIEEEKSRLMEYPGDSGPFDLTMKRNISPIKSIKKKVGFLLDSFQAQNAGEIEEDLMMRSKSARRIKDLRRRQKSKNQMVRDLENFHKSCKHQVRNAHMKRNMDPGLLDFDETKSANIYLQSKNAHGTRGYISPSKRLNMPLNKSEKLLKRAKSALPLKFKKEDIQMQTARNPRDKVKPKRKRLTLTPVAARKKEFSIGLQEANGALDRILSEAREDSPGYSVKLSYSHYAPSNKSPISPAMKRMSPRSKLRRRHKDIRDKDRENAKALRRKERLKKKKKIMNVVYGDKIIAGGSFEINPKEVRRAGVNSALKMVKIL